MNATFLKGRYYLHTVENLLKLNIPWEQINPEKSFKSIVIDLEFGLTAIQNFGGIEK